MTNKKTIDTPEKPVNPILQLIQLSLYLPEEATADVANRIADWVNSGETLLTPYVAKQIVYAKEAARAYQIELLNAWNELFNEQKAHSPLQQACWCKDCKHGEASEDEGKPYCICNNNKSNNW